MAKEFSNELQIKVITGRKIRFVLHELRGFLVSRQLWIALVTILILIVSIEAVAARSIFELVLAAIFWVFGVLLYVFVTLVVTAILVYFRRSLPIKMAYMPLLSLPGVAVVTLVIGVLNVVPQVDLAAGNTEHSLFSWPLFARNMLIALGFEFLVLNWVFTDYLTRTRLKNAVETEKSNGPRTISANGRSILIEHIISLEANQHYVQITTRTGKIMVRSTLKTIMGQIDESDGLQVHRSFWVAKGALTQLSGSSGKKVVHLTDGRMIPVSRPREEAVETWFKRMGQGA